MPASPKKSEPVTEYVLKLLSDWEASGKKLKDLDTGMAPSMTSQVKGRTSAVTNYSGPRFAKAFGMTYPELVSRAYAWFASERSAGSAAELTHAPPPARAEAIAFACEHGATMEEIEAVLAKYGGPAFDGEDVWGWLEIFKREGVGQGRKAARQAAVLSKKGRAAATTERRGHRDAAIAARRAREGAPVPKKPAKSAG